MSIFWTSNYSQKSDKWKIQLTIANNFISSIGNDDEHVMHSKSGNIETKINDFLKIDIKLIWNQWKVVSVSLIMFSYFIINVIKQIQVVVDHT